MVGSRRCYICEERFARGDEITVCDDCGVRFHVVCIEARGESHCPRCANEEWIATVEF